MVIGLHNHHMK